MVEKYPEQIPALISHDRFSRCRRRPDTPSIDLQRLSLCTGGCSAYERARAARLANPAIDL